MDWTQTITLMGTMIGSIIGLAGLILWVFSKLDGDIKSVGSRVDGVSSRMDGHAGRIDQLYQMFVDLLKEKK